jgi:hypothetical protein
MDFTCSVPAYEMDRGFLTLHAEPRISSAIGNQSIEKFNGAGSWDKLHIATTFMVASGDIVLIRRTGLYSCPGLLDQIQYLAKTKHILSLANSKSGCDIAIPSTSSSLSTPASSSSIHSRSRMSRSHSPESSSDFSLPSSPPCASTYISKWGSHSSKSKSPGLPQKRKMAFSEVRVAKRRGPDKRVNEIVESDIVDLCDDSD